VHTDFSFFVSHASGVFYISLEPWIRKLENELSQPQIEGADFRIQRLLESANSVVDKYLQRKPRGNPAEQEVTSCVVIEDGNVGYLLLTTVDDQPQAAFLDAPEYGLPTEEEMAEYMHIAGPEKEVRQAWQPPKELYEPVDVLGSISIPTRHRALMKEVKTSRLQYAVSDLFNRATRLQEEFRDQVWRTSQITTKIDAVTGTDEVASNDGSLYGSAKLDERLENVRSRQDKINARYEALRNKMNKVSSSELSEKEASFVEELSAMDSSVDQSNTTLTSDVDGTQDPAWQRIDKLRELQEKTAKEVERATKEAANDVQGRNEGVKVPSQSRKLENEQISEYMARLTVLVEAAAQRLRTEGIAIPVGEGSQD
jgi:nucleoporin NUP82